MSSSSRDVVAESERLHQAVRELASGPPNAARFDELALELARFQVAHIPGYRRLVEARGSSLESVARLPAVPTDAFRLTRVAVHGPEHDVLRFHTSGTTRSGQPGVHALRTAETYRHVALSFGRRALLGPNPRGGRVVVALAPPPGSEPRSSLGFMMRLFMDSWDGRALSVDPRGAAYEPESSARWLASSGGVDAAGLERAARVAIERHDALLILATSFALVGLLDALSGSTITVPKRTTVMFTGGFKGRTREVSPKVLRRQVARALRIPAQQVVGEYGMTELSSQLYEGVLPESELSGPPGVYLEPHWLQVVVVDPATLEPVADGEVGLAKLIDLANVDSAVAIVTQDRVRRRDGGIELLGRQPGAIPRGCSLAIESLLASDGSAV